MLGTPAQSAAQLIERPRFLPACLVIGAALRVLWILTFNAMQTTDFESYRLLGLSIANGTGYYFHGRPFAYYPVGYPGFLGLLFYLFGTSTMVGKLANVILSIATAYLTYVITRRLLRSERAGKIAACILAFSPNQIAFTDVLSTEIYFGFLILAAVVVYLYGRDRSPFLVLSGVLFGFAVLTKMQGIVVPVLVLLVFFTGWRSFLKQAAVIAFSIACIVGPWMARNYAALGTLALDLHGGIALFQGNNPYEDARGDWDNRAASEMLGDLAADESALFDGREPQRDERARAAAVSYIVSHPGRTLRMMPKKLFYLWASDVDGIYYSVGPTVKETTLRSLRFLYRGLRFGGEVYYGIVVVLFFVSAPVLLERKTIAAAFGLLLITGFTGVYLFFFGVARYHFSLMPWVAMYAGLGGEHLAFSGGSAARARAARLATSHRAVE